MRRSLYGAFVLFLSVGLTACSDDPTDPSGLSEQEVEQLAEVIFGQALTMGFTSYEPATTFEGDPGIGMSVTAVPFSFEIPPEPFACPLGGEVVISMSFSGDVDDATGAGTIDMGITQDHADCVVQSEEGTQFTLNGAPETTTDVSMSVDAAQDFTMTGAFGGGVQWATGGRSDTCTIDLGIDASGNLQTGAITGTVSGIMCGQDVSQTF